MHSSDWTNARLCGTVGWFSSLSGTVFKKHYILKRFWMFNPGNVSAVTESKTLCCTLFSNSSGIPRPCIALKEVSISAHFCDCNRNQAFTSSQSESHKLWQVTNCGCTLHVYKRKAENVPLSAWCDHLETPVISHLVRKQTLKLLRGD